VGVRLEFGIRLVSHVWSWVDRSGCDGQEMHLLGERGEVVTDSDG